MKKIFTLLFAVGTISIASAQSKGFDHSKQVAGYSQNGKHGDLQKFNHGYNHAMAAGKMNSHLNAWEQSKQIRMREEQRRQEIARVQYRFEKNRHQQADYRFVKSNKHTW